MTVPVCLFADASAGLFGCISGVCRASADRLCATIKVVQRQTRHGGCHCGRIGSWDRDFGLLCLRIVTRIASNEQTRVGSARL